MRFADFKENVEYTTFFTEYEKGALQRPDYDMQLSFQEEPLVQLNPKFTYLEMDREAARPMGELSSLWNERVGSWNIGRKIETHFWIKMDSGRRQIAGKAAVEQEQTGEASFHPRLLQVHDLYPQVGDHLLAQGFRYEILEVLQKPEDLWQMTNLPLWVTARISLYRFGEGGVQQGGKK